MKRCLEVNESKSDEIRQIAEVEGYQTGDRISFTMPSSHAKRTGTIMRTLIDATHTDVPLYVHTWY